MHTPPNAAFFIQVLHPARKLWQLLFVPYQTWQLANLTCFDIILTLSLFYWQVASVILYPVKNWLKLAGWQRQ